MDTVGHEDVDEALRLMDVSKASLQEDVDKEFEPDKSAVSQIFRLIKGMAGVGEEKVELAKRPKRLGRGPGRERDMDVDTDEDDDKLDEELALIDIRARVLGRGFTEAQLNQTIIEVSVGLFRRHQVTDYPSSYI
jgi:DNA replication licensing factor MCM7